MIGFLIGWIAFGLVVLGLAIYRKSIASHEQDWVHLAAGEEHMVDEQITLSQRLKVIDRWGIWLTVVLAIYGVIIGGIFILRVWEAQKTLGM
jgi:hypothetical protein